VTSDPSKKFAALLKRLRLSHPAPTPPTPQPIDEFLELDPPTRQFVFSMLLWETNTAHARAACRRLSESFVDGNELRIAFEDETAHVIGDKYPQSLERARRLRAALGDIYRRFHGVTIVPLLELNKRDARHQVESIEGVPPFVAARMASLVFGAHAIPVDERLRALLADEAIADEVTSVESVEAWLERTVAADESHEVAAVLQAWSDDMGHAPRKEPRASVTASPKTAKPANPARKSASTTTAAPKSDLDKPARSPRKASRPKA